MYVSMLFESITSLDTYLLNLLAIVGGLILLVQMGPGKFLGCCHVGCFLNLFSGGLSVDEKKKTY
jgi:hypothetical protein